MLNLWKKVTKKNISNRVARFLPFYVVSIFSVFLCIQTNTPQFLFLFFIANSAYEQAANSNATLPVVESFPGINNNDIVHQTISAEGSHLKLNSYSVALLIPDGAVSKHQKPNIMLSLLKEEKLQITNLSPQSTVISPVVYCGPSDLKVNKPVVLKLPHCAENLPNWQFSLYHTCDSSLKWSKVVTIGEETINTPSFVQIDDNYAYVLTEAFGKYVLVGESSNNIHERVACKKLRLFLCGPLTVPEFSDCSIRVYIFEDIPGADERCRYYENEIGGVVLSQSSILYFNDNSQDLSIEIKCVGGWKSKPFHSPTFGAATQRCIVASHSVGRSTINVILGSMCRPCKKIALNQLR